jgi:C-terminal processing protease CtpA/Prc
VRYCWAVALLLSQAALAQSTASEQDRLIATARLWATVKYFHPYLAYRDIDWDKALVDALPQIRAAASAAEYAKALSAMLDALHDPVSNARMGPADGLPEARPGSIGERVWIHFGLAGSAFATRAGVGRVDTADIPMGDGVEARVRLSEAVFPDTRPIVPLPQPDRAYREMPYPSTEYRILAAYKIWAVFHNFFAYRDLMDEDWDDVFAAFLPKFIAAGNASEYNLAVAEMIAHVSDSNATVESGELSKYFGEAPPGLRLRLIEKKPVVTEIFDKSANEQGIEIGDIVTKVDGEDIVERINREAKYFSASTTQSLGQRVAERLLNGPEGSTARLTIRDRDGRSKEAAIKRTRDRQTPRDGEAIKTLPDGIGYVDLDRLDPGEIEGVFEKFRGAKAIIFDGRGSTHGLGSAIAAHLTTKTDIAAAIVTGPLTIAPDLALAGQLTSTASFFRVEALPAPREPAYTGKTAMLIDERTRGEAEQTGLYLEAANNTVFVGSASAGANAEIGSFVVPGGITITYSSNDVRHGNGGKLQRLGLQPSELVSPTVAGVRAGRDEVLEHAVEYVSR